jgi:phosphatidylglycerophosphate synthase
VLNLPTRRNRAAWWAQVEINRRRHTRATALFWTHNINHRLGAALAIRLRDSRVTPNLVSVISVVLYLPASVYVLTLRAPVSPLSAVAVFVIVQLAYTLDCTDGLLARLRGQASAFGGWLDRVFDFCGHVILITSLLVFTVRSLNLDAAYAALITGLVLGTHLTQMFASFYRTALLGSAAAERAAGSSLVALARPVTQLTDYGLVVLVFSAALLFPPALLAAMVAYSALLLGMLAAQVALNWPAGARPADG